MFARTGEPGPKGISAFLVDGRRAGLSVERLRTMGMPGWQLGAPRFEDVEVPEENLLGEEGDGFKIAMATFDRSRPTVAAQAVGLGQGAIDLAVDYSLRRHAFGEPLFGHQGIQFKLAEHGGGGGRRAGAHLPVRHRVDEGDPRLTKSRAMAKLMASDAAMRVTTEAVQVLGGNGYLKEFPAERMMRDAKVLQIYEGANEIQGLVISRRWPRRRRARADVARVHAGRRGHRDAARARTGGAADEAGAAPSGVSRRASGRAAVDLAVEGEAHVAAADLDAAGVVHEAGLPAHDAVTLASRSR